jgi:hypothetical protein
MRYAVALLISLLIGRTALSREIRAQGLEDSDAWEEFHRNDVHTWARKSGLSIATLQHILNSVGRDDGAHDEFDEDQYSVQEIDTRSLANRKQILIALTGFGTSHPLAIYVVRAAPPYRVVWQAQGAREQGECPGGDFGTESILGRARVSVSTSGQILVKIPIWNGEPDEGGGRKAFLRIVTYTWSGKTYVLRKERDFSQYTWNGLNLIGLGAGIVRNCDRSQELSTSGSTQR